MVGMLRMLNGLMDDRPDSWSAHVARESKTALLDENRRVEREGQQERRRGWVVLTVCNALLFVGAVILYAATWSRFSGRNYCLKATSTYCKVSPFREIQVSKGSYIADRTKPTGQ